jgi:hypothetical protein
MLNVEFQGHSAVEQHISSIIAIETIWREIMFFSLSANGFVYNKGMLVTL